MPLSLKPPVAARAMQVFLPSFLSPDAGSCASESMTALTDKAKMQLANRWVEVLAQLGASSILFREAAATKDPWGTCDILF